MRKNSLSKKGLSMSQAQSVSNLCNQRAIEIDRILEKINNVSKIVKVDGEPHILTRGISIPSNVVDLLKEKSSLNACQAFLMENIKAKDALITSINISQPNFNSIVFPIKPIMEPLKPIPSVSEEWGWEQLSAKELAEFYEAEAYAAQIGKFIHKNGKLNNLREELPTIPSIEWMNIEDNKKSPVVITLHHTPEQLLKIHETLAEEHRIYESKVNYFKAKVKNLVNQENARIASLNETTANEYHAKEIAINLAFKEEYLIASNKVKELSNAFSVEKQDKLKEASNLRIEVDTRFQSIIDKFLEKEIE